MMRVIQGGGIQTPPRRLHLQVAREPIELDERDPDELHRSNFSPCECSLLRETCTGCNEFFRALEEEVGVQP